jgi:hypothetical protein
VGRAGRRYALEGAQRGIEALSRLKGAHGEHVWALHAEPLEHLATDLARAERLADPVGGDLHPRGIHVADLDQPLARVPRRREHARSRAQRPRQHQALMQRVRPREPLRVLQRHHVVDREHQRQPAANGPQPHRAVQQPGAAARRQPRQAQRHEQELAVDPACDPRSRQHAGRPVLDGHELHVVTLRERVPQAPDRARRAGHVELQARQLEGDGDRIAGAQAASSSRPAGSRPTAASSELARVAAFALEESTSTGAPG